MKDTLVVNLFGAPGAGKSTTAAGVFADLKDRGICCELVTEYAKDCTWEGRHETLSNQLYVFGKQHHRINRLLGKTSVIITDSPLLLSLHYGSENTSETFKALVKEEAEKLNSLNFFITRVKKYNPNGRNQTEGESDVIADKLLNMLKYECPVFEKINGNLAGRDLIVRAALAYSRGV